MYDVKWDEQTGGILLIENGYEGNKLQVRPVFFEELDLLGFNRHWKYPKCKEPLLWATAGRRYFYRGEWVAEAKGGGFFEPPTLVFHNKNLDLQPVDLQSMLNKNAKIMEGIIQQAIEFIYKTHQKYLRKVDTTAVAFSGGKDSLVLLDLVQRALAPDEFVVVFNDTTMEISPTIEAIEKAKQRWSNLTFYTARADTDAQTTWRQFGPPSRLHRWCCTVHKSAPTLLLLRKLAGKPSVRALVYDGVRGEESAARAGYSPVTEGGKHSNQINASPLLNWNSAEIFLYLLQRDIFFNSAYRYGLARVGCAVCPFSSKWTDSISWMSFKDDIKKFIDILKENPAFKELSKVESEKYIRERCWKARAGGRDMENGGNKVLVNDEGNTMTFFIRYPQENWMEWAKTLGPIVKEGQYRGRIESGAYTYPFQITRHEHGLEITVKGTKKADRFLVSHLRVIANKTSYCVHCRGCEVECPTGALKIIGNVYVDEEKCIHCARCLSFKEKGCLAARSLEVSKGGKNVKGLNRYQQFGMRKEWLEEYFRDPENWWHKNELGNRQFDAMKVWLKEAEIIENNSSKEYKITTLGKKLKELGVDNLLTWAVIWTNLARNSALINWYVNNVPWGSNYSKKEMIEMLGEELAHRTRKNALDALDGLLKNTPLGSQLGFGEVETKGRQTVAIIKRGWSNIESIAVLYALYRYAEKIGRYDLYMGELYESACEGPYTVFGIDREDLAGILRGLSSRWGDWISVEIVKDLDNIYLDKSRTAAEVLDLV